MSLPMMSVEHADVVVDALTIAGRVDTWNGFLRAMTTEPAHPEKLRVIIAGGGVAALETALALAHLAPGRTDVTGDRAERWVRVLTADRP